MPSRELFPPYYSPDNDSGSGSENLAQTEDIRAALDYFITNGFNAIDVPPEKHPEHLFGGIRLILAGIGLREEGGYETDRGDTIEIWRFKDRKDWAAIIRNYDLDMTVKPESPEDEEDPYLTFQADSPLKLAQQVVPMYQAWDAQGKLLPPLDNS